MHVCVCVCECVTVLSRAKGRVGSRPSYEDTVWVRLRLRSSVSAYMCEE